MNCGVLCVVTVSIHATLEDDDDEHEVVTRFSQLMVRSTDDKGRDLLEAAVSQLPAKRRRRILDSVMDQLVDTLGNDIELISLTQQNSIEAIFVCSTASALTTLRRMYLSTGFARKYQ